MSQQRRTFDSVEQAKRVLTNLNRFGEVKSVELEVDVEDLDVWELLEHSEFEGEEDVPEQPSTVVPVEELQEPVDVDERDAEDEELTLTEVRSILGSRISTETYAHALEYEELLGVEVDSPHEARLNGTYAYPLLLAVHELTRDGATRSSTVYDWIEANFSLSRKSLTTWFSALVDGGYIDCEEAEDHPGRNIFGLTDRGQGEYARLEDLRSGTTPSVPET